MKIYQTKNSLSHFINSYTHKNEVITLKNNLGIKLQLLGIGLIAFFPYSQAFTDTQGIASVYACIVTVIGVASPIIGLILCIAGLFYKEK